LNLSWLPASLWCTNPSRGVLRRQIAISSASRGRSVRRWVASDQPTIMRENTSMTNATCTNPAQVRT